jgi:hypothetical protein
MKISELLEGIESRRLLEDYVYLLLLRIREAKSKNSLQSHYQEFVQDIRIADELITTSLLHEDDITQAYQWLNSAKKHLGIRGEHQ